MRGLRLHQTRRARDLRQHHAEAERLLRRRLRGRALSGFKFARQEPIGPYFVDFVYCEETLIATSGLRSGGTARPIRRTKSVVGMRGAQRSWLGAVIGSCASSTTKLPQHRRRAGDDPGCVGEAVGAVKAFAANRQPPSPLPSPRALRGEGTQGRGDATAPSPQSKPFFLRMSSALFLSTSMVGSVMTAGIFSPFSNLTAWRNPSAPGVA